MLIVIQCASTKTPGAGFLRSSDGKPVSFVANPTAAPPNNDCLYARPDDLADDGRSWRKVLLDYNAQTDNSLQLLMAYRLYENRVYEQLVAKFGLDQVYILSAGWGLIRASFLTPYYDITFSASAELYKRRRPSDPYDDFCMMQAGIDDRVVFFGGKDYIPLFCRLTESIKTAKTVFFNLKSPPSAPGCKLQRFPTTTKTNWHYECANAFLEGKVLL